MKTLSFYPLSQSNQSIVDKLLKERKSASCQFCFENLWCLREKYGTEVSVEDDVLYVRQPKRIWKGHTAYFPPLGHNILNEHYNLILHTARNEGHSPYLFGITEDMLPLTNNIAVSENRDWAEYLYIARKFKNYSGSGMACKRRDARVFLRLYENSLQIEAITQCNIPEIKEFQKQWVYQNSKKNAMPSQLYWEHKCILGTLDEFERQQFTGLLFRIDGKIAAYSYGIWLNEQVFDICVQKADYDFRNINQALLQAFIRKCCPDALFVNFEEDMGILGLRRMKMSYKPDILLKKYDGIWMDAAYE